MPLIENDRLVEDAWTRLAEDDEPQAHSRLIVPAARLAEVARFWPRDRRGLAAALGNGQPVEAIAGLLDRLDMVVLEFPAFTDGRAFSQARTLRTVHQFPGRLRASGHFIPDQYGFLLQAGFDSFEVDDRHPIEAWTRHAGAIARTYQRDYAVRGLAVRALGDAQSWLEQPHYG